MEISFCCGVDEIRAMSACGIKSIELPGFAVAALDDTEFELLLDTICDTDMRVVSINCLIGQFDPLAQISDLDGITCYFKALFARLQKLGVPSVVFGSGGFRSKPDDAQKEEQEKKFDAFMKILCTCAEECGLLVALEPLNSKECNFITTAGEGNRWVLAHPYDNLMLLIDLFHFDAEQESLTEIPAYGSHLGHIHIASPQTRTLPKSSDEYDYSRFFNALKKAGYDGCVSVEASRIGMEGIKACFNFLKSFTI